MRKDVNDGDTIEPHEDVEVNEPITKIWKYNLRKTSLLTIQR